MTSAAIPPPLAARWIVRRGRLAEIQSIHELASGVGTAAQWTDADYEKYCVESQATDTEARVLLAACTIAADGEGEAIVGFAAFSAIPDVGGGECELQNMAVAELWRRQGIARRFLDAGVLWCRAWCPARSQGSARAGYPASAAGGAGNTGLRLEVRSSNGSAIAFYKNAGFVVNGRRSGYYLQPEEDAVLMARRFDSFR